MTRTFLSMLVAILCTGAASAQWPVFCVYHAAGNVQRKSPKLSRPENIVKGNFIIPGDSVILGSTGSLILFDHDTNYVLLREKGRYAVEDIQKIRKKRLRDNITIQYAAFVWEDLLQPRGGAHSPSREQIAGSPGGAYRGDVLMIAPTGAYRTSCDSQLFRWRKVYSASAYRLGLSGSEGRLYYQRTITDTQVYVTLRDSFPSGDSYTWELEIIREGGKPLSLEKGTLVFVDEQKTLPTIPKTGRDSPDDFLQALQYSDLCEKEGCIKKADSIYRALLHQFPDDAALRKLYQRFLRRNYLTNLP